MNCAPRLFSGLLVTTAIALTASGAEPPELRHNPFSRPSTERLVVERQSAPDAKLSSTVINLRATMAAPENSLANVGGRILRAGDEVEGYLLLKVYEDRAVFSRDGRRLTVYVKPDPEGDDE